MKERTLLTKSSFSLFEPSNWKSSDRWSNKSLLTFFTSRSALLISTESKLSSRLTVGMKKWRKFFSFKKQIRLSRSLTSNSPLPKPCLWLRGIDCKYQKRTVFMTNDDKIWKFSECFSIRAFKITTHCLSFGPVSENNKYSDVPKVICNSIISLFARWLFLELFHKGRR